MEQTGPSLSEDFTAQAVVRIQASMDKIQGCLKELDDTMFWAIPNENSNGVAQLLRHLQGNIGQYIISGLGGNPDLRDRPAEFDASTDADRETITSSFVEVARNAQDLIRAVPDSVLLERKRVQGFELSGLGIILHVVEHLSYHTGQIAYLTKLYRNIDLGFYRDFDLNQKNE